jgi:uncharacterized protein (DUF885 family)
MQPIHGTAGIRPRAAWVALLCLGWPAARPSEAAPKPAAAVKRVADAYLAEFSRRSPAEATLAGIPGVHHDTWPDNSAAAEAAWQKKEDAWLAQLRSVRSAELVGTPAWVSYGLLRAELEASAAERVCRRRLWNVSHLTGPVNLLTRAIAVQPVGTAKARAETLARLHKVPAFLEGELANLREGARLGYTAQKNVVERALVQLDALIKTPVEESPFLKPKARDPDPEFGDALSRLVADEIAPALLKYRDYLRQEYLTVARAEPALAGNPQGDACYSALVRRFTSLELSPRQVHDLGREQLPRVKEALRAFTQQHFGSAETGQVLRAAAEQPAQALAAHEVLAEVEKRIAAARGGLPRFFKSVPRSEPLVEATPAYEASEAPPARYRPGSPAAGRPGAVIVNVVANARPGGRFQLDSLVFHEGVPGHHLQQALALERAGAHPVERVLWSAAFGEGWALYAEDVAGEMGAYTSPTAELSRMNREVWETAVLTSETGALGLGWSRQQAIDYLVEAAGDSPMAATFRTDRQAALPGQMLSYAIGRLEIQRLREEARQRLGARFDVREFHERVLENGNVTLPMLREHVERWLVAGAR